MPRIHDAGRTWFRAAVAQECLHGLPCKHDEPLCWHNRSQESGTAMSDLLFGTRAPADDVCARNYEPLPVTLVRGRGVYVWDEAGRRYMDMMSAYSAVSHGHSHPALVAALTEQAQRLSVVSRAFNTDRLTPFLERACA